MTLAESHPSENASPGGGRTVLRSHTLRLATPVRAFGPLVLGIGAAVLGRLLLDLPPLLFLRARLGASAGFALTWLVPVIAGGLVSGTRTLWIELSASGLRVKRMLGRVRFYEISEIVAWGFEHGRGTYSTLPPTDPARAVRFYVQTADSYRFEKPIRVAHQLSAFLVRGRALF